VSLAVGASLVLHALFVFWMVTRYKPVTAVPENVPIARYVQLITQNPREFTEAPGPRVESAPITAPYSDANRRASMPEPTGDQPTKRPGAGDTTYSPPMQSGSNVPAAPQQAAGQPSQPQTDAAAAQQVLESRITPYIESAASANVDWRSAIKEVGRVASLGGSQSLNLDALGGGGEKGFAEAGPLSFETQWYDWGEYAQSMVSRIRVNWYAQMPPLIRTGMKGQVTIRFTILRDGRITNVQLVKSSDIPPYDFAAKKAIELSSPLNPLPKDFPNESERVTAMFYYNMAVPVRR
jgi:TonB family protein